jgi:sugar lactone lactonase YvrE
MNRPYGIAFGKDGKLYVSSFFTDELLRYDATTGAFVDVFKKGDAMPGGLNGPNILAFGPDDQLYVTTQGSVAVNGKPTFPGLPSQVLKIDVTTGAMSVFIDQPALSPAGHGFISLLGIAFDPSCEASCNLYVSDFANDIRVYEWPGGMLKNAISTNYTGTMPSGNYMGGVSIGDKGNIFTAGFATAEGNVGTVLRFDSAGAPLPANGQPGSILVNADSRLLRPIGILALQ